MGAAQTSNKKSEQARQNNQTEAELREEAEVEFRRWLNGIKRQQEVRRMKERMEEMGRQEGKPAAGAAAGAAECETIRAAARDPCPTTKATWREKNRKLHPDRNPECEEAATEAFKTFSAACKRPME